MSTEESTVNATTATTRGATLTRVSRKLVALTAAAVAVAAVTAVTASASGPGTASCPGSSWQQNGTHVSYSVAASDGSEVQVHTTVAYPDGRTSTATATGLAYAGGYSLSFVTIGSVQSVTADVYGASSASCTVPRG